MRCTDYLYCCCVVESWNEQVPDEVRIGRHAIVSLPSCDRSLPKRDCDMMDLPEVPVWSRRIGLVRHLGDGSIDSFGRRVCRSQDSAVETPWTRWLVGTSAPWLGRIDVDAGSLGGVPAFTYLDLSRQFGHQIADSQNSSESGSGGDLDLRPRSSRLEPSDVPDVSDDQSADDRTDPSADRRTVRDLLDDTDGGTADLRVLDRPISVDQSPGVRRRSPDGRREGRPLQPRRSRRTTSDDQDAEATAARNFDGRNDSDDAGASVDRPGSAGTPDAMDLTLTTGDADGSSSDPSGSSTVGDRSSTNADSLSTDADSLSTDANSPSTDADRSPRDGNGTSTAGDDSPRDEADAPNDANRRPADPRPTIVESTRLTVLDPSTGSGTDRMGVLDATGRRSQPVGSYGQEPRDAAGGPQDAPSTTPLVAAGSTGSAPASDGFSVGRGVADGQHASANAAANAAAGASSPSPPAADAPQQPSLTVRSRPTTDDGGDGVDQRTGGSPGDGSTGRSSANRTSVSQSSRRSIADASTSSASSSNASVDPVSASGSQMDDSASSASTPVETDPIRLLRSGGRRRREFVDELYSALERKRAIERDRRGG